MIFQLPGIAKMFSSEMTLASAWIHLLAVDLFAARFLSLSLDVTYKYRTRIPTFFFEGDRVLGVLFGEFLTLASFDSIRTVYYDGLESNLETRHSVSLCLLFCPIGIVSHIITKALTKQAD